MSTGVLGFSDTNMQLKMNLVTYWLHFMQQN